MTETRWSEPEQKAIGDLTEESRRFEHDELVELAP